MRNVDQECQHCSATVLEECHQCAYLSSDTNLTVDVHATLPTVLP